MGKLSKGELLMYLDLANCNRQQAANLAGVSRQTIQNLIRDYHVSVPRSDVKLHPIKRSTLRKMRESGVSSTNLAARFGVSRQLVYRLL
jgi:DNA-binding XRE family transcriptional regulator